MWYSYTSVVLGSSRSSPRKTKEIRQVST